MSGLILDSLVALLLVATIFFCIVLNNRLVRLREGQDQLGDIVVQLDDATRRAQESIHEFNSTGINAGRQLDQKLKSARAMAEELDMLTDLGESLANRLSGSGRAPADGRVGIVRPVMAAKTAPATAKARSKTVPSLSKAAAVATGAIGPRSAPPVKNVRMLAALQEMR